MKTAERVIKRDKELSSTVCETSKDLATVISQLNRKYIQLSKKIGFIDFECCQK